MKSGRAFQLARRTGMSNLWCREFLKDVGAFSKVVAEITGRSVREMDYALAMVAEKQLKADRQVED